MNILKQDHTISTITSFLNRSNNINRLIGLGKAVHSTDILVPYKKLLSLEERLINYRPYFWNSHSRLSSGQT